MFDDVWSDFGSERPPTFMKNSICTIKLASSDRTVDRAFLEHGRRRREIVHSDNGGLIRLSKSHVASCLIVMIVAHMAARLRNTNTTSTTR